MSPDEIRLQWRSPQWQRLEKKCHSRPIHFQDDFGNAAALLMSKSSTRPESTGSVCSLSARRSARRLCLRGIFFNACQHLRNRDRSDQLRLRRLDRKPAHHFSIGLQFQRLRHHIGVKNNHSNALIPYGRLSRTKSTSMPPIGRTLAERSAKKNRDSVMRK